MRGYRASATVWLFGLLLLAGVSAASGQEEAAQAQPQAPRTFSVRELSHETYRLGCIDTQSCIQILGQFGYNTNPPGGQVKLDQLPAVFPMPAKAPASVVGQKVLSQETISAPMHRLMIVYHSSQSEDVARLKELLEQTIDVPARLVQIEAMFIELSEDTFKEMGVQWDVYKHEGRWLTFKPEGAHTPLTLFYSAKVHPEEFTRRVATTIQMVIQEGKAEVLSRPSVLVLNNQNAKIEIVRDTPILKQTITRDFAKIEVRFEKVGIVLNIMPRVSHDDSTIAMQILAEVSEIPEGEWIVIPEGAMAGTKVAPSIDRRVVQTVARVPDGTPLIIGGLIRNEKGEMADRIPVLSRIPILGVLFQRRSSRSEKREVIIVLTPTVIRPAGTHRLLLPKDSARFDFLENVLFRNTYRLKAKDVFDLRFLEEFPEILEAFARARQFVTAHPEYAERSPFKELAAGVIPGEDAVVIRMVYEVVKKLGLHERLDTARMIFFEKPVGFDAESLERMLLERSPDGTLPSYFAQSYPKEVLIARSKVRRRGGLEEPAEAKMAEVEWRKVSTHDEVEAILRSIEELSEDCSYHEFAFALESQDDLQRLKDREMTFFKKGELKLCGFDITFLEQKLKQYSPDGTVYGYFARPYPKEVLFFRYKVPAAGRLQEALLSPVANVEPREVQDRDEVEAALLEMNRLHEDYTYHEFAFVLDNEKDLVRLKAALALREVANVNNFEDLLLLRRFRVGRRIAVPQFEEADERTFLIDQDVAEFFFKSDYYYYALMAKLEQGYRMIQEAMAEEGD